VPRTDILAILMWVAVFGLLIWFIARSSKVAKQRRAEEEERRVRYIEEGVKKGILAVDGRVICVTCKEPTSDPQATPRTGRTWIDKLPGLSWLDRLYSLPSRYGIEDNDQLGQRLCPSCKRSAVEILHNFHSQLRAEQAKFNASQRQKIETMERGGLEKMVASQIEEAQQALGIVAYRRQLMRQEEPEAVSLPPFNSEADIETE